MGDDADPKRNTGIPAWQRSAPSDSPNSAPSTASSTPPDTTTKTTPDSSQANDLEAESQAATASSPEARIDQAVRFLNDASLKDAPVEEKVSFLESKGLSKSEIDQAMKQSPPAAAAAAASSGAFSSQFQPTPSPTQSQPPPPLPNRDIPPIITYPEFLMHSQKPPPIITARRLLNTAYIAAGISAAVYGASKYLVAPMTDALTDARHDFASHVQAHIDELNAKLRGVVSSDAQDRPLSPTTRKTLRFKDDPDADDDDAASSHSDPTELFHRDFGTQTSPAESTPYPNPPRSPSTSSSSADELIKDPAAALSSLSNSIAALTSDDILATSSASETSTVIAVLSDYLESLAYPTFASGGSLSPYSVGYSDKNAKQDDETSRFRAEVRGVKGVLLSARNFPGSGGGRRAMFPPHAEGGTAAAGAA